MMLKHSDNNDLSGPIICQVQLIAYILITLSSSVSIYFEKSRSRLIKISH